MNAAADAVPPPEDTPDAPGDPESVARVICLRLLTVRARSRAELETALRKRGVPDEAAEVVLDRFTEVGLIDDAAYAQTFVQVQQRERGLAGRAVAAKLRQRGLADDIVRSAVATIDPASELASARDLVRRKLRGLLRYDAATRDRRLLAMLARRGYSTGVAASAIREVVGASSATSEASDYELANEE